MPKIVTISGFSFKNIIDNTKATIMYPVDIAAAGPTGSFVRENTNSIEPSVIAIPIAIPNGNGLIGMLKFPCAKYSAGKVIITIPIAIKKLS